MPCPAPHYLFDGSQEFCRWWQSGGERPGRGRSPGSPPEASPSRGPPKICGTSSESMGTGSTIRQRATSGSRRPLWNSIPAVSSAAGGRVRGGSRPHRRARLVESLIRQRGRPDKLVRFSAGLRIARPIRRAFCVSSPARSGVSITGLVQPHRLVLSLDGNPVPERHITLHPRDLLFACCDGITAAASGQTFSTDRVKELVQTHAAQPAAVLVQRVLEAALKFYVTPKDDMSLIVIKRTE